MLVLAIAAATAQAVRVAQSAYSVVHPVVNAHSSYGTSSASSKNPFFGFSSLKSGGYSNAGFGGAGVGGSLHRGNYYGSGISSGHKLSGGPSLFGYVFTIN